MPTLRTSHGAWRTPQPCAGSADAAVRFAELAASYDHRVDDIHRWVRPPLAFCPGGALLTLYAVHSMPHVLTFVAALVSMVATQTGPCVKMPESQ